MSTILTPPVTPIPRIWRTDQSRARIEALAPARPYNLQVVMNPDAEHPRRCTVGVIDPDSLRPHIDWILVELDLLDAEGRVQTVPLGHYLCIPSGRRWDGTALTGTIEGYGATLPLEQSTSTQETVIEPGIDPTAAAATVFAQAGFPPGMIDIPPSGTVLEEEKRYPAGESRRAVGNALLAGAGYYHAWPDGHGIIRSRPFDDYATAAVAATFGSEPETLTLFDSIEEQPDWLRLANRVTVRKVQPDAEPIVATAEITDPASPLHPENLRQARNAAAPVVLGLVIDDPELASEAAAREKAKLNLAQRASYYRPARVTTVIDDHPDAHQIIGMDVRDGGEPVYTGRWWRRAWTLEVRGPLAVLHADINQYMRVA